MDKVEYKEHDRLEFDDPNDVSPEAPSGRGAISPVGSEDRAVSDGSCRQAYSLPTVVAAGLENFTQTRSGVRTPRFSLVNVHTAVSRRSQTAGGYVQSRAQMFEIINGRKELGACLSPLKRESFLRRILWESSCRNQ